MALMGWTMGPRRSAVSWFFIELFALISIGSLPYAKSASEISVYIALTLWFSRKFPYNERFPSVRPCNAAYAVFLALVLLSLFRVPPQVLTTGVRGVFKWIKFLGIFFMFIDYARDAGRVKRFAAVWLTSVALAAANGFYQLFNVYDLVQHYSAYVPGRFARMSSCFGSPNDLAAFLIAALPAAFALWLAAGRWGPAAVARAALVVLLGTALVLTLSRGALLALMLACLAYAAGRVQKRALGAVLLIVAGILLASPVLFSNFVGSMNLSDITIGERLRFWQVTWNMIREHPLLGNGVNMYVYKFGSFAPASELYRGYAHNCYLQMWSEIGLFGLIAFLYPFVILVGEAFKTRTERFGLTQALAVGLGALLVQSFFDTNFYAMQTATLFWMLWGLFAGLSKLDKC